MNFSVEYTDTFGGEANYCWVRRYSFEAQGEATDRQLMRRAKALAGLSGVKGRKENIGEGIAFYPRGSCTVLFVNAVY